MGPSGNKLLKMMPPMNRTARRIEVKMVRLFDSAMDFYCNGLWVKISANTCEYLSLD
jgi:hypothetical protein